MDFELWLEFEETQDEWDIHNEFCNINVTLPDGRKYGINVWTFQFMKTALDEVRESGGNLKGSYLIPPDLFVKELTCDCIYDTIADLLEYDSLEMMLNPSIVVSN